MKAFITILLVGLAVHIQGTVILYVNLGLPPGLSLLGMPFTIGDNQMSDVFVNIPVGSEFYKLELNDHQRY